MDSASVTLEPETCMIGDRCGLKVFIADESNLHLIPPGNKFSFAYLNLNNVHIHTNNYISYSSLNFIYYR